MVGRQREGEGRGWDESGEEGRRLRRGVNGWGEMKVGNGRRKNWEKREGGQLQGGEEK